MNSKDYISYLVNEIHTTIVATVDDDGLPVTAAIDMMDCDDDSIFFLTAKGKSFYNRLKKQEFIALTGLKGESTMTTKALSIRGKVRELGSEPMERLFKKNPYMYEIYPTEESRKVISVFQIFEGTGEWFDLSKKPIEIDNFSFGGAAVKVEGYHVTESCTGCGDCIQNCPQGCIEIHDSVASIKNTHCIQCGNCFNTCPINAIEKIRY